MNGRTSLLLITVSSRASVKLPSNTCSMFFKNTENLIAKLESYVKTYQDEQAIKELRTRLEKLFKATNRWCYQKVLILPPIDEIELEHDKVTLIVTEPNAGSTLRTELQAFFDDATWKNRIAYLTGAKNTYKTLLDVGKRLKAIDKILADLREEKAAESDPQMVQATTPSDIIHGNFHSVVRETFTMGRLKKYDCNAVGISITIGGGSGVKEWIELSTYAEKQIDGGSIEQCLKPLRQVQGDGQVKLEMKALHFATDQGMLDWVEDAKQTLSAGEFKQ